MKIRSIRFLLPLLLLAVLPSCNNDDDPVLITTNMGQANLHYDADGTWTEVASNQSFALNYLWFNHEGEIGPWGLTWRGFTPARWTDLDYEGITSWLPHQFQIPTRGGVAGVGTPYVVAFWDNQETDETPAETRSCRITYRKDATSPALEFHPMQVYLQLTCYTRHAIMAGDDFTRPFTTGDWLLLTAHGVRADGTETTQDIYLADFRGEEHTLMDTWTQVNLQDLGYVTEVYFTMASSDTGQWGMNTPSYFALDRLTVQAELPE